MLKRVAMSGRIKARVIRRKPARVWWWKVRNFFRHYYRSVWRHLLAKVVSRFGITVFMSELRLRVIRADGQIDDYGVVSRRYVTDDFVDEVVDCLQNSTSDPLDTFHFHACGTGIVAENQTDSALGAESTTITDRATGTFIEGASTNIFKTVGTQTFTGGGAITEHGVFDIVTESTGILMDRSVFSEINVVATDQIEWTYELTVSAGG